LCPHCFLCVGSYLELIMVFKRLKPLNFGILCICVCHICGVPKWDITPCGMHYWFNHFVINGYILLSTIFPPSFYLTREKNTGLFFVSIFILTLFYLDFIGNCIQSNASKRTFVSSWRTPPSRIHGLSRNGFEITVPSGEEMGSWPSG